MLPQLPICACDGDMQANRQACSRLAKADREASALLQCWSSNCRCMKPLPSGCMDSPVNASEGHAGHAPVFLFREICHWIV